jgi:hypothetical protein
MAAALPAKNTLSPTLSHKWEREMEMVWRTCPLSRLRERARERVFL